MGSFLPAAAFPARPGCRAVPFGRFPARRTHPSLFSPGKSTVFFGKKSPPLPYTCVKPAQKKGKKPGFFSPARAHRPPGNPAGTAPGKHTAGSRPGQTYPAKPTAGTHRREPTPGNPPPGHTARRRPREADQPEPPARAQRRPPGRGWSDPLVCLAATAPQSRVNIRQIRGWGYQPSPASKKPPQRTAKEEP